MVARCQNSIVVKKMLTKFLEINSIKGKNMEIKFKKELKLYKLFNSKNHNKNLSHSYHQYYIKLKLHNTTNKGEGKCDYAFIRDYFKQQISKSKIFISFIHFENRKFYKKKTNLNLMRTLFLPLYNFTTTASRVSNLLFIIRLKGKMKLSSKSKLSLKSLGLQKIYRGVIKKKSFEMLKKLEKLKEYLIWGDITDQIAFRLMSKLGRMKINNNIVRISDFTIKQRLKQLKIATLKELILMVCYGNKFRDEILFSLSPLKLRPARFHFSRKVVNNSKFNSYFGFQNKSIRKIIKTLY
mmetsp:Transcript_12498/g.19869  ORF Transcript_12498/g.19869 Transcript_12498/m.19869 type:complete len:296 (-) Transcript_12498:3508-4395(-)